VSLRCSPDADVGVQLCRGKGGAGKSAIGVAASSAWGWDPDPVQADRNGFGQSWNSTVNNLERVFSGYNQTTLFLNETGVAGGNTKQAAESILEAIMKMEGSVGKGRLVEVCTNSLPHVAKEQRAMNPGSKKALQRVQGQ